MPATRIILIRHGETDWNSERRMQGQTDSKLSTKGQAQARALARRMRTIKFDRVYSSDLSRAFDTARSITELSGHLIIGDSRLRERGFGVFEGLLRDEIRSRYPKEFERFRSLDADFVIPGGESAREFFKRTMTCLEEIARTCQGMTVLAVCHGLVLDNVFRHAHGLALDAPRAVDLFNASLNSFVVDAGTWELESWGDIAHLSEESGFYVEE